MRVPFTKVHPLAKTPVYGSREAAAFDVFSVDKLTIAPGAVALIHTGICMAISYGHCLQVWDRSSMGLNGIHRFAGLIDSDYRGQIGIVLYNSTPTPRFINIGDKIAQLAIVPVIRGELYETDTLPETERGEGGFGSTGQ